MIVGAKSTTTLMSFLLLIYTYVYFLRGVAVSRLHFSLYLLASLFRKAVAGHHSSCHPSSCPVTEYCTINTTTFCCLGSADCLQHFYLIVESLLKHHVYVHTKLPLLHLLIKRKQLWWNFCLVAPNSSPTWICSVVSMRILHTDSHFSNTKFLTILYVTLFRSLRYFTKQNSNKADGEERRCLDQIDRRHLIARHILSCCTCHSPDYIPHSLAHLQGRYDRWHRADGKGTGY